MKPNTKQFVAGLLAGIFAPGFMITLIYGVRFSNYSISEFVEAAIRQSIAAPIIALSLMLNLGLFFLFLKFDRLYAGRGTILSTLLYGMLMLYIKLGL